MVTHEDVRFPHACRGAGATTLSMRLGYACITLGMPNPSMRTAQLGRYQRGLVDLAPIYASNADYALRSVHYSARHGLHAFRVSSDLFPLLDCAPDARALVPAFTPLREVIHELDVHVSNHPSQFVVLSTPSAEVLANSLRVLADMGWMMEGMGAQGSITVHGGGVYGDRHTAGQRLHSQLRHLDDASRRHLALENDEKCWTVMDLLDATRGEVPIVFDVLHWEANPRSASLDEELHASLASWPPHRLPEIHYSEQALGKPRGAHADFVHGRKLLAFMERVAQVPRGMDAVVIVEAKQKDLAIQRAVRELPPAHKRRLLALVPGLERSAWLHARRRPAA